MTAVAQSHTVSDTSAAHLEDSEFETLLQVCANLTVSQPLEEMLSSLLTEARRLVRAQAGSLYVVENERLRFICAQNDVEPRACRMAQPMSYLRRGRMPGNVLPLDTNSLAGYVASTGAILSLPDVYSLDESSPYRFDSSHDCATGYCTRSVLAIPLEDGAGRVLGVLQAINRVGPSGIEAFEARDRRIMTSFASIAAMSIRNAQLHDQLQRSHMDTILRLSTAAEFRDGETGEHIRRMSCYCEAIARQMADPEWSRNILFASPMHDVGKLGVPDAVLNKPGPLTDEERRIMQQHTTIGARILEGSDTPLLQLARRIAHSHHERWDGRGYPQGIAGTDVPLEARIAAVADVFDALTSPRVYKAAIPFDQALEMIRKDRGSHFDPDVADAFSTIEEEIRSIYEAYHPA